MTIRYQCDTCGSTLNIKDELAGTDGKCPKCKSVFTVPQPGAQARATSDTKIVSASGDETIARPTAPPPPPAAAPAESARSKTRKRGDDEFDPMAVLMGDEQGASSGRGRAPAPAPLSDDELPADLDLDLDLDMSDRDADDSAGAKKAKKRKRVQFDSDDDLDVSVPNSASATADAMLGGGASAGAKELLTRTMEESRARAARLEDEEPKRRGPKLSDYARELAPKIGGALVVLLIASYGLFRLANSMYGGGMPLPELGRVYGTVTLDGDPLVGAKVRFVPADRNVTIDERGRQRLRTSTAVTDDEGFYELHYTEDHRGAAVAKHRVIIMKMGKDGRLITPAAWADFSMEIRDVEPGSHRMDFPLISDARGQLPPPVPEEQ